MPAYRLFAMSRTGDVVSARALTGEEVEAIALARDMLAFPRADLVEIWQDGAIVRVIEAREPVMPPSG